MLKQLILGTSLSLLSAMTLANNHIVEMQTSLGAIEIELFNDQAPITTKNFEEYVKSDFHKGTVFHRAIDNFMVQGGGFVVEGEGEDKTLVEKDNKRSPIKNEAGNGLENLRGTLAMARTNDPDSARSQFFINVADNAFLNRSANNAGYAVFGRVTKGMEVVDQMLEVPTKRSGMHQDVPETAIVIESVNVKTDTTEKIEK